MATADAVAIPTALWAALALKFDRLNPALDRTFAYFLVAVASALFFFYNSFTHPRPVVDLRIFRNSRFAMGCLFQFVLGIGVFSSIYLIPQYLASVQDYRSLDIGKAVFITGIAQVLATPFAAGLSRRMDPRHMILFGFLLFALSLYSISFLNSQWGKDEWRDWKRAQNDWKEQWKDQWAAQWREHWQDEATRWQRFAQDSMEDWTGRRSRDRADSEQMDELRATFMRFRDEVRTMARERRGDLPVTQEQLSAAREVLERAARELRDIFRG